MRSISPLSGDWAFAVDLTGAGRGELARLESEGRAFLRVCAEQGVLTASLTLLINENRLFPGKRELTFELTSPVAGCHLRVEWREYSVRLVVDGALMDEDWPIGALPEGEWTIACAREAEAALEPLGSAQPDAERQWTGPLQFFSWPGHNTGVGDCMPFSRDGRYCLYFLFDRRAHRSKAGLGAHQWAQISSSDLKTWTLHPMAVPVTAQWEGSICTGSLIERDGLTYAFYAARMADGSPAQLTWAVSEDGVRFEKSGRSFELAEPYEGVSARDPMVFLGADGRYHMLVTTSLVGEGRYGGCLAHLISDDLLAWQQLPPFIVPGYADQPECSDYFEWNGWYYLVFSNFATARYRMSRQPFGPWSTPEDDVLDSVENQVPKTAAFGDRRLITGFLARHPRTYAGNAVTHELVQRENGTLGVRFVEEIMPALGESVALDTVSLESAEGRVERQLLEGVRGFRLRASLTVTGTRGGLTLHTSGGDHRIDLERAVGMARALRPDEEFRRGDPRLQLAGLDLSASIELDMLVVGDMLDALIGGKAMTMRLACDARGSVTLSAHAQAGALKIERIMLQPLA